MWYTFRMTSASEQLGIPASHHDLIARPLVATLTTVGTDGLLQSTAVWYLLLTTLWTLVQAWIERADSVRVDTAKLDRMLNLAGEIAVAHGRLRQVLQDDVQSLFYLPLLVLKR